MSGVTFMEAFARVADARRSAVALEAPDGEVTYEALRDWASTIAAHLDREGVRPGDRVGLSIGKSAAYVAALLGTWRAGAAFVPLDPGLPAIRRQWIIEDVVPSLILETAAVQSCRTRTAPGRGPHAADAADTAYIIYTSGTTGRPKGVIVPHRGLLNLLEQQIAAFALDASSRAIQFVSTAFDASLSDIGTTLLAGATLVIPDRPEVADASALASTLERRRITHADLPPSILRRLDPSRVPSALATVVIGGEPCDPAVARRWAAQVRLVNVYGPTEATICTSLCVCDPARWTRPLIGAPLAGVQYRVRARTGEIDTGELFIASVGLADGYVNQPELTAERFPTIDGVRMYRTGDVVRRLSDGELEFVGRADRQVKIRGVRIELEEIESALREHASVADAAVTLRRRPGDARRDAERLCAFVESLNGVPSTSRLREHLAERLPPAMIPRWFVVTTLPRLESGKIDRQALDQLPIAPEVRAGAAPVAGEAAILSSLWADAVGSWPHDCDDGFVDAGGDSLAAVELSAAAETHGLAVTAETLLGNATLGDLLAGARGDPAGIAADDLRAEARALVAALDPPHAGRGRCAGDRLFLTGATGFFGAYLLAELLHRTSSRVSCLVRARDSRAALDRLRANAGRYELAVEWSRVDPVCGDVSRPRFGLASDDFLRAASAHAAVYHAAAVVHMALPLSSLRAPNVHGTLEAVRLARTARPKPLHYVSTLSVFVGAAPAVPVAREDADLSFTRTVYGGYAQSKWLAEECLRLAGHPDAPPIACYRLGLVTGDTRTGAAPGTDQLSIVARGLARLGRAPLPRAGLRFDVTPVDRAASVLATLSLAAPGTSPPPVHHVAGATGATADDLVDALREEEVPVVDVAAERWVALGAEAAALGPDAAAAWLAFCRALPDDVYRRHRSFDLFAASGITFDTTQTCRRLGAIPPADERLRDLLRLYVRRALPEVEAPV